MVWGMRTWQDDYKARLSTADEAVKLIKSGNRVVLAHAVGEPLHVMEALVRNAKAYKNVEIDHFVILGKCEHVKPEYAENFRDNGLFLSAGVRAAHAEGRSDFTPCFFHEGPDLFRTKLHPDVCLLQVSPPDEHGYCSAGTSVDFTVPVARDMAKVVIAQVNKNMPRTLGDSFIHISKFTAIVEHDEPLSEVPPLALGEVELAIGKHVAALVRDGDCLQLGIGGIPDAVAANLGTKNDLGLHTEMFADGVIPLLESGVINNTKKQIHAHKTVASFLMGTRKLYDYVDNNPSVEMYSVDYVNNPRIASTNDNVVAINGCVEVDLYGQVVSDSIGYRQISGVGGQVDFVRAAAMSKGGRSIMAMPSTTKGLSKIVPLIAEGAAVTTSRFDVDYIVTEFGVASLKGETLRNRARALIDIAHPDHRPVLVAEYEKRFKTTF
jgi:4-hydroxybutyrate CoA-transferase